MMDTNKAPSGVSDVITERVGQVPDAAMRTTDRMFNVAGKAAERGTKGEDQGSAYGTGAVSVETQVNSPDSNMRTNDRKFKIADVEGANSQQPARLPGPTPWRWARGGRCGRRANDGGYLAAQARGTRKHASPLLPLLPWLRFVGFDLLCFRHAHWQRRLQLRH